MKMCKDITNENITFTIIKYGNLIYIDGMSVLEYGYLNNVLGYRDHNE